MQRGRVGRGEKWTGTRPRCRLEVRCRRTDESRRGTPWLSRPAGQWRSRISPWPTPSSRCCGTWTWRFRPASRDGDRRTERRGQVDPHQGDHGPGRPRWPARCACSVTGASARWGRIAYVPQRATLEWDFPTDVLDVVTMGTYGRLGAPPSRRTRTGARSRGPRAGGDDPFCRSRHRPALRWSAAARAARAGPRPGSRDLPARRAVPGR
jgi:hypothetical protein